MSPTIQASLRRASVRFAATVALVLVAHALRAQPPPKAATATNAPPVFEVKAVREDLASIGAISRAHMTVGTNKFAFLVPHGFQMRPDVPNFKAFLVHPENGSMITIQFHGLAPARAKPDDPPLKLEPCRDLLMKRHPGARMLEEFTVTATDRAGLAFDLIWRSPAGPDVRVRSVFLPTPAGVFEFNLQAGADRFDGCHHALNTLLVTLRIAVDGKLDVPPLSDKF